MSVSETCNCRVRWVVGHFHWMLQDYDANGLWSERLSSAYCEHASSSEEAERDESPYSINNDDEHRGWARGRIDRWNGRRDSRLNDRRNGWHDGGLIGWRVRGWDRTPRSSFPRTPTSILCYWEKCCPWYAPEITEGCYTAVIHAVHQDHNGFTIDGINDSEWPIYHGQTDRRRRTFSFRRERGRVVRGTEWF